MTPELIAHLTPEQREAWERCDRYEEACCTDNETDSGDVHVMCGTDLPPALLELAQTKAELAALQAEAELQKTRQVMMWWSEGDWCVDAAPEDYRGPVLREGTAIHKSRLIGLCIAALRALGVEFTLAEGWDQR